MPHNYSNDSLSFDERDDLVRRLAAARRRQLGLPPVEVPHVPTPEEITERAYCDELSQKILAHELDAGKFWSLTNAS